MSQVGGMVLAAGLSERMEGPVPKQLLPMGHGTLVARTVRNAEASRLDRVVVVTGYRAEEVAASVAGGRAEVVENPRFRSGNLSSFRAGAAALTECDAVVVLLGDMPGITAAMIDGLIEEWRLRRPWAVWSVFDDRRGHPLLLSAAALEQSVQAEGPKGLWRFLEAAPEGDVLAVRFAMPAPADINTRADYEGWLRTQDWA